MYTIYIYMYAYYASFQVEITHPSWNVAPGPNRDSPSPPHSNLFFMTQLGLKPREGFNFQFASAIQYPKSTYTCVYIYIYICIYIYTCIHIYIYIYGTGLQPPPSPPAMGMVPRIGCTTSLESNYHARYLCFPAPPLWGGLGVVCMYLRRLVGIGMYVCMHVCMSGQVR